MLLTPHRKEFLIHSGAALMIGFVAFLFWRHLQTVNALDVGAGSSGAEVDPIYPGASPWGLSGNQPGGTGYVPGDLGNVAAFDSGAPAMSLSQALDALGPSTDIAPLGVGHYDYQTPAAGATGDVTPSTQPTSAPQPTQAPAQPGGGGGVNVQQPRTSPTGPSNLGPAPSGVRPAPPPPPPTAPDSSGLVQAIFDANSPTLDTPQLDIPPPVIPPHKIPTVTTTESGALPPGSDGGSDVGTAGGNGDLVNSLFTDFGNSNPFPANYPTGSNGGGTIGTVTTSESGALPPGYGGGDGYGSGGGYDGGSVNDGATFGGIQDYGGQLADNSGYSGTISQSYLDGLAAGWGASNPFGATSSDYWSPGGYHDFGDGSQNPYDSTSGFFYE